VSSHQLASTDLLDGEGSEKAFLQSKD
jgi:hypothetical protein